MNFQAIRSVAGLAIVLDAIRISGATTGQTLVHNGTEFRPATPPGGAPTGNPGAGGLLDPTTAYPTPQINPAYTAPGVVSITATGTLTLDATGAMSLSRSGQIATVQGSLTVAHDTVCSGAFSVTSGAVSITGTGTTVFDATGTILLSRSGQTTEVKGGLQVDETSIFTGLADFDAGLTIAASTGITGDGALTMTAAAAAASSTGFQVHTTGGPGGASSGVSDGGTGGVGATIGGTGGAGSGAKNPGGGGPATLQSGDGGTGGTGNANSGNAIVEVGTPQGTGIPGNILIGTVRALTINIGHSGSTTTVTGGLSQLTGALSLASTGAASVTSSAALTITGAAASVWSTSAGSLTVQGAASAIVNAVADDGTSSHRLHLFQSNGVNKFVIGAGTGGVPSLFMPPTVSSVGPAVAGFATSYNGAESYFQSEASDGNYYTILRVIGGFVSNIGSASLFTHINSSGPTIFNGDVQAGGTQTLQLPFTDSSGTPGAATINKASGRSAFAAGASSVVVTNSVPTSATSHSCFVHLESADTTTMKVTAVVANGSITFTSRDNSNNAVNATATCIFRWMLIRTL
jgi:hypothetical protein